MPHATTFMVLVALLSNPVFAGREYGYRIIDQKPQARDLFVQGLEIVDDKLYVSSGGYGNSRLLRFDFASGKLEIERKLDPRLFAEGITILGDRLYQLTWRERLLLVWDSSELTGLEKWRIPGQGWGMTNDGERILYSDGSDQIYFLSPSARGISHAISVTESGKPVHKLNELEWIEGKIWANIWQTDRIVIIEPTSGAVEASVNLAGLLPLMARQPGTGVLNGIARDPADGGIWVTGKNWPWLYKIELVPPREVTLDTSAGESR